VEKGVPERALTSTNLQSIEQGTPCIQREGEVQFVAVLPRNKSFVNQSQQSRMWKAAVNTYFKADLLDLLL
jgi:hypothetical protein